MLMRDMSHLWTYKYFRRGLKRKLGIDERRHIRWDPAGSALFFVVPRSRPAPDGGPGRFPIDEKTLEWLLRQDRNGRCRIAYLVLVEDARTSPPPVVYYCTARMAVDRLDRVPVNTGEDGNTYWWMDDDGEPFTGGTFIGPGIDEAPFEP